MDPITIITLVTAALPILEQLLAFGEQIAKAVTAAQAPGSTTASALPALSALQTSHATTVASIVSGLAAAVAPKS